MPRTKTKEERLDSFMKKVNKQGPIMYEHLGPCWEWTGIMKEGYGIYSTWSAHRLSYELHKAPIKENMFILHLCDNRACVNPYHLREGTRQENIQDMNQKGRAKGGGSSKGLTKEQHFWKRAIYQKKIINESLGECWETKRDRQLIWYENKPSIAHRTAYKIKNGDIPEGKVIRHTCDNSKCINPAHLLIGTQEENINDAKERNRFKTADQHHNSKLTNENVLYIYASKDKSLKELATEFNVTDQCISKIWNRKHYISILPSETNIQKRKAVNQTLVAEDALSIYNQKPLKTAAQLSKEYHVSESTIYRIWTKRMWSSVLPQDSPIE